MSVSLRSCVLISAFFVTLSCVYGTTLSPSTPTQPVTEKIANATVSLLQKNAETPAVLNTSSNIPPSSVSNSTKKEDVQAGILFSFFGRKAIGESCQSDGDCDIKESFCINGSCQCSSEYVPSPNKMSCLIKARELLDNCIETVQCEVGLNATGLVICAAHKCICDLDAVVVHGKCYKRLVLGNKCERNEECSIPFSSCIQNVCACSSYFEPDPDNRRCIVMKAIEAAAKNCTDDHICNVFGEEYHCRNGTCMCKPGLHFSGTKCIEELRLGAYCEHNEDCTVDMELEKPGIRQCKNNACTCIAGFKADKVQNLCKSSAAMMTSSFLILFIVSIAKIFTVL